MANIFDWSATPASVTSIDGVGCNTGMSPSNVDNVIRALAAAVRNSFLATLQNFWNGTAPLPVANGGTAATSASAALTNLGGLSSVYRDLVRVDKTDDFALAESERANGIALISGATPKTITINSNATTSITRGAVYAILNFSSASWTVTPGSGVTLLKNGATSSASAVLAAGSVATLTKWDTDIWTVNGVGVS